MRKSTGIDLGDFVAALSQEGSKESTGVFALDPEHARRKLREYQLAHPHAYVGAVLAAACLGGSSSIHVEILSSSVRTFGRAFRDFGFRMFA